MAVITVAEGLVRIEANERGIRQLRWSLLALAAIVVIQACGVGWLMASRANGVSDREIAFRDSSGRIRLTMGLDKQGSPQLVAFDKKGVSRVMMALSAESLVGDSRRPIEDKTLLRDFRGLEAPGLRMNDADGSLRMVLMEDGVTLFDNKVRARARLSFHDEMHYWDQRDPNNKTRTTGEGTASLDLYGPSALRELLPKQRVSLGFGFNGDAELSITSGFGLAESSLRLSRDGEPSLKLASKEEATVEVGFGDQGPGISIGQAGGGTRAVLGSTSLESRKTGDTENLAPSSLVLFDKDGKVIFRVP